MSSPPPRRRRRGLLVAVALVLLLIGGAAAFLIARQPGDVSNPDVEFTAPPTTTQTQPPKPRERDTFRWPTYGFTAERTRDYSDAPRHLRPPFRRGWTYRGKVLLEFPPAIDGPRLFVFDDDAELYALDKRTGRVRWHRKAGRLAAASPAIGDGRVYVVALRGLGSETGRVAAFRAKDGRKAWAKALPSRAESSPLLRNGKLFFGSEDGTVYALDARTGRTRWTYRAAGAVKGGLALSGGTLYFGDYGGRVHAVRARDGRRVWSVGTSGTRFGFGSGRFYSTPAVAFGRVYIGNTDSRVYSFSARTGALAWAIGTGAYVYGSPAVANTRGLGPTVYVGSYDGTFYAFDARSGRIRWRHRSGAKISGSATIVGNVVYFSNLGDTMTEGLDARTGKRVFSWPDGAFNAVVADRRAIYLAGYTQLYEMLPVRTAKRSTRDDAQAPRAKRQRAAAAKRAAAAHRRAVRQRRAEQRGAQRRAHRRCHRRHPHRHRLCRRHHRGR